jgi:hypothetical protein
LHASQGYQQKTLDEYKFKESDVEEFFHVVNACFALSIFDTSLLAVNVVR